MFSGIVASVGRITRIDPLEQGVRLTVDTAGLGLDDVALGDSIANNGVCLTVVGIDGRSVLFDVSRETLNCTAGLDAPGSGSQAAATCSHSGETSRPPSAVPSSTESTTADSAQPLAATRAAGGTLSVSRPYLAGA